ncbi:hypothetical protein [Thioalkalivibrio paradoxus]|uniref:hypothetical protein n=1 Tax=Thioalkalivibrio paradoxus TaxID=108010 RepID=UPI0003187FDE|nr:hypothetical protein [Thioalkalivibrio paradoxus]
MLDDIIVGVRHHPPPNGGAPLAEARAEWQGMRELSGRAVVARSPNPSGCGNGAECRHSA